MNRREPTTAYALAVDRGEVVAGELVKLACRRHLEDLETGHERGLWYDPAAAALALGFFELLRHSKGRWAGKPFGLQPWQQFLVGCVFGWKRADGTRRFRVAHLEVARKNGKTTLASGIGLFLLVMDGEPGAEVYTAATTKKQAALTHGESVRMRNASPALKKRVAAFRNNLSVSRTNSKYEPLAAEGDKLDGLNTHGAITDELHAWKDRLLWDVLETATGAREQPLFLVTTTAGTSRHGIWWERRQAAIAALKARSPEDAGWDDSLFSLIYTLDDQDSWEDESAWVKSNPSLGVTVQLAELREKAKQAKELPGKQNAFRRLRLNVPTEQVSRWLDVSVWDEGARPVDAEALRGRPCWAGLDLARVKDLSALVLLFPPREEGERWQCLCWFWCPEEDIQARASRDHVPYGIWARQGHLTPTPGNFTDFGRIGAEIVRLCGIYDVREVAYDRTFAGELVQTLTDEGIAMVEFGQGFLSMAGPTGELERLVTGRQLSHGGHPILRWNAANVAVKMDPAGNLKPDRQKSGEKIDGIVALTMALGRAMLADHTPSVYETRGVMTLGAGPLPEERPLPEKVADSPLFTWGDEPEDEEDDWE